MAKSIRKFLKFFTLIELIIVIAVIAVLGASAFLVLSQWMSKSRDSRKIADLGTIDTAINVSYTSNDKLPTPDNKTDILFSGNIVWEVGYFGDEAVKQIGGALTKTPIDPTTKERYRYGVWNNKYQLGTIIENEQFSKYSNRVYANEYFTRLQGNYNQTIIIAKIDNVDTILPVPSLIIDEFSGATKALVNEHFWTNKGTYNLGGNQSSKLKVEALFSGNLSLLSNTDSDEFNQFITNFEKVFTGSNFVNVLNNKSQDQIKVAIAQELSKVSSQPVSVLFLGCEGYNHGAKVDFYKQESVGYGESCDSIKSQFECNNGNWIGENKAEYTKTICNAQLPAQCDGNDHGTVKDFYSASSVAYGQSCTPNLKSFTCENGTWKDGGSNADTSTYQYTSCIVGNPVDCNATNITKKSVTNLDIIFDLPATLHGLSFEKSKTISENNGSYEYTLVGDCSNGTYQEVNLSEPVNKGCNTGYNQEGNSCVPKNCAGSTQTVNSHIYIVGSINHGLESTVTTSPITISNGTITYTHTFSCNLGVITPSGAETTNTPTCNSGYIISGNSCVLDAQWSGNANDGFIYSESSITKYPTSCNDLLVSTTPNFKYGTSGAYNGTKFVDGVYWIKPDANSALKVYCDMTTDGGGWTLFTNIISGSFTYSTAVTGSYGVSSLTTNILGSKPADSFARINIKGSNFDIDMKTVSKITIFNHSLDSSFKGITFTGTISTTNSYVEDGIAYSTSRYGYSSNSMINIGNATLNRLFTIAGYNYPKNVGNGSGMVWILHQAASGGYNVKNTMDISAYDGGSNNIATGRVASSVRLYYK